MIELCIGITIMAVLLAAGMPSFSEWMQNTKIRTAAELLQNGMQFARTEAIRRNAAVRFSMTDSTGAMAWTITCNVATQCPDLNQTQSPTEVNGVVRIGVMTDADVSSSTPLAAGAGIPASVVFSSLGRVVTGTNITRADIIYAGVATARRLVITVSSGGQVRMCDPARPAGDPQAC